MRPRLAVKVGEKAIRASIRDQLVCSRTIVDILGATRLRWARLARDGMETISTRIGMSLKKVSR